MTAQDARSEIARLITALLQIGLAVASNPPVIYQVGTIRRVLWSSAPRIAIGVPPTPFGTVADYRRLLDQGQYNLVLFDGALLMAIIEFRRDELIKQSLTYYPCPVDLPPQGDLFHQSIGELVDDALFGSLETMEWLATLGGNPTALGAAPRGYSLRMRAPLRFDFDLEAEAPLHILHPTCIWGTQNAAYQSMRQLALPTFYDLSFETTTPKPGSSPRFFKHCRCGLGRCISGVHEGELFLECLR